jgi:hypothetical protein
MTEHGRVPVCRDDGDEHDQHCFHAHALLFAVGSSITLEATSFYQRQNVFPELSSALDHARTVDDYMLISEHPGHYVILSGPLNAPRQLARTLVAIVSGIPNFADWRLTPRSEEAQARAAELRAHWDTPL